MALQASIAFRGISVGSAYVRIERLSIDLVSRECQVFAAVYADNAARQAGEQPIDSAFGTFTVDPTKAIPAQAYAAIKLALYPDAVDV